MNKEYNEHNEHNEQKRINKFGKFNRFKEFNKDKFNKEGQVTLFIIVAIVIVAIIISLIFFKSIGKGNLSKTETNKINNYLSSCFKIKAEQGILLLGKQGGYFSFQDKNNAIDNITFLGEKTVYYWKNNKNLVPSLNTIQNQLDDYLNENIGDCFSSSELFGYIFEGNCTAKSNILTDKINMVNIEFDCPVIVKKNDLTSRLKGFEINVNAPISKLVNVSNQIILEYSKNPGYICVTCFDDIASANNVTVNIIPITKEIFEPEHVWFLITDKNMKIDDKNITWRFVSEL